MIQIIWVGWMRSVKIRWGCVQQMRLIMASWSWKAGLAGLAVIAATAYAVAQMPEHSGTASPMVPGGMPMQMHERMMKMMQDGTMQGHGAVHGAATGQPAIPGQAAFGAIQEVVQILEADPTTDWTKVNIGVLREHLIDMSEVTLHAAAAERALDNAVEITVSGEGRTLQAIKRMVPAHARELVKMGWNAATEELPNGVKLTVTTSDPKQVAKLKALGFVGIMVEGAHHQPHHLMMAKGEFPMH
jgi:hypothetical protein